jgi:hypothetical protein
MAMPCQLGRVCGLWIDAIPSGDLTAKRRFYRDFRRWRGGREAEGGGLLIRIAACRPASFRCRRCQQPLCYLGLLTLEAHSGVFRRKLCH